MMIKQSKSNKDNTNQDDDDDTNNGRASYHDSIYVMYTM